MTKRAAGSSGFSRRYDYTRYKLTIGYTLLYAGMLVLMCLLLAFFAAGDAKPLPEFVKTTVSGRLYLYNLVIFCAVAVVLVASPRMLIFDGIPANRWNLYFKSGISASRLIINKLLFCYCAPLRIYLIGAAVTAALGWLTCRGETAAGALDWVLVALAGACVLLVLVAPGVFFGSFLYNRLAISGISLVAALGVSALLVLNGYTSAQEESAALVAVRSLVLPSPASLSVIALACLALGSLGAYLFASAKIRNYEVEELDDEELIRLGITKDIVVYERDEDDDLSVAISGPELFEVQEPTVQDFGGKQKEKKAGRNSAFNAQDREE